MDFLDALEAQISNVMSRFVVNLIMHEKRHDDSNDKRLLKMDIYSSVPTVFVLWSRGVGPV